ncbi:hypothetical protein Ddc_05282 [Ditylenchus destructor]|nr:hypothetical protein Ddc_05282 [Ditylenchus destructor]
MPYSLEREHHVEVIPTNGKVSPSSMSKHADDQSLRSLKNEEVHGVETFERKITPVGEPDSKNQVSREYSVNTYTERRTYGSDENGEVVVRIESDPSDPVKPVEPLRPVTPISSNSGLRLDELGNSFKEIRESPFRPMNIEDVDNNDSAPFSLKLSPHLNTQPIPRIPRINTVIPNKNREDENIYTTLDKKPKDKSSGVLKHIPGTDNRRHRSPRPQYAPPPPRTRSSTPHSPNYEENGYVDRRPLSSLSSASIENGSWASSTGSSIGGFSLMGPDGTQYPVKKVTRKSRWVSVHDGKPVSPFVEEVHYEPCLHHEPLYPLSLPISAFTNRSNYRRVASPIQSSPNNRRAHFQDVPNNDELKDRTNSRNSYHERLSQFMNNEHWNEERNARNISSNEFGEERSHINKANVYDNGYITLNPLYREKY